MPLKNGNFEDGFRHVNGINELYVANEWTPYSREQAEGDPAWKNRRPEYKDAAPYKDRIWAGQHAQQWFTWSGTHSAGIYQVVSGFTPGDKVTLSAFCQVWSLHDDGEHRGEMAVRIGIDPTGMTDPWDDDEILWSEWRQPENDVWKELCLPEVEVSERCTVFLYSTCKWPVRDNNVYYDTVMLTVEGAPEPDPEPDPGDVGEERVREIVLEVLGERAWGITPLWLDDMKYF